MDPVSCVDELINVSIQSISAIITSIAAFATVIIAFFGLQTWKKQIRGKSEYELAKRLLVHIYQLREAILFVRNPWQVESEIEKAMKENKIEGDRINDPYINLKTENAIYSMRWKDISEAFTNLETDKLEAEAVWGPKIEGYMKPIIENIIKLRAAVGDHLTYLRYNPEQQPELEQPHFKILYNFSSESRKDAFSEELSKAIEDLEAFLKPSLRLN